MMLQPFSFCVALAALAALVVGRPTASAQAVLFSDNFDSMVSAGSDYISGAGEYSYGYDSTPSGSATKAINYDQWARQGQNSIASDIDGDGDRELRPNRDGANNAKLWGIILNPSHFAGYGGQTLTIRMDLIGADPGNTRIFLAAANGYDTSGSNTLLMDVTEGGFGTYTSASGTGSATVTQLFEYQIPDETLGGSWSREFTYTEGDALILTFGSYNSSYAFDNLSISDPSAPPPPPPPPPPPVDFDPNPDGGVEPAPLPSLDPAPNVVIFIADDMGIGDTSAYQDLTGNADSVQIDTPEMERLANLGTRFTDAHTNGATCSPTRISLLSGTYSFRSPLKTAAVQDTNHTHGVILPGRRTTIAHMLQRAGYRTYGYGKWHMALRGDAGADTNSDGTLDQTGTGIVYEGPIESGFDTYTGTPGNFSYAGAMLQDKQYVRFGSAAPNDYSLVPINDPSAQPWLGQGPNQPTDPNLYKVQPAVFEKLQSDLANHMDSQADEPFFIYYASHSNHDPWVPANYEPDHPDGPRASLNDTIIDTNVTKAGGMIEIATVPDSSGDGIPDPDYSLYDGNGTSWIWNDALRVKMWDHVTEVDAQGNITVNGPTNRAMMVQENDVIVGYLLDFLEQTDDPRNPGHKLIDNTIFIFTSDNGADAKSEAAVGALPQSSDGVITDLTGFKGSRWEGGSRVPFIAAWPNPADANQASGIPAGATSSAIFGLNDVYATLAEAIGHRLHPEEAVDSESLLPAWTAGQGGTVRSTDLLSKFQQRIFSRRGEFKLAALDSDFPGSLTVEQARQDRFADNNELDFDDMVIDTGQWAQYVRKFVDLSNDLSELNDLGATSMANDMLASLQTLTTQGYSREGASDFENGLNFEGGDLQTASNWHAYKSSRNDQLPSGETPGILAEDGSASGDLNALTLVHRAGTLSYNPGTSGGLSNSHYELDGGRLNVSDDLRLSNARMELYRGQVNLGFNELQLTGSNAVVILSGADLTAARLSVAEAAGATEGFKIIRIKGEAGTLELTGYDPIGFADDGSASNDYIDFVTGAHGRLVTTQSAAYFSALWDSGQLRIDGAAGAPGAFDSSPFQFIALGDGRYALELESGITPPPTPKEHITSGPNFIIIVPDDHRWDATSFLQNRIVSDFGRIQRYPYLTGPDRTPNMDRLATEGLYFDNGFVTYSLCSPSRATMLTGVQPFVHGITANADEFDVNDDTYAKRMQAAGWSTGYFGKWHMGKQTERPGFDHVRTFYGQGSYYEASFYDEDSNLVQTTGARNTSGGSDEDNWVDKVSTDYLLNYLNACYAADERFLAFLGFKTPHDPRVSDGVSNAPVASSSAANFRGLFSGVTQVDVPNSLSQNGDAPVWKPNTNQGHGGSNTEAYMELIAGIDHQVGRVLDKLDTLGIAENTVVIYISDNGYFRGEHGLGDKRAGYEESLRVPFMIRYPAIQPAGAGLLPTAKIGLNLDIAPTILDIAGLPVPQHMQGRSLKPLLEGTVPSDWRESFVFSYVDDPEYAATDPADMVGIRTESGYKLIRYAEDSGWDELFDVRAAAPNDAKYENNNYIADSTYAATLADLQRDLELGLRASGLMDTVATRTSRLPFETDFIAGDRYPFLVEKSADLQNWQTTAAFEGSGEVATLDLSGGAPVAWDISVISAAADYAIRYNPLNETTDALASGEAVLQFGGKVETDRNDGYDAVLVFELPPLPANTVLTAAQLEIYASRQWALYDADLWAIGIQADTTPLLEYLEHEPFAGNVKLQDRLMDHGLAAVPTYTTVTSSLANGLAPYLREFYQANPGYSGGHYLFLRINSDINVRDLALEGNDGRNFRVSSANSASNKPVLHLSHTSPSAGEQEFYRIRYGLPTAP